MMLENIIGRAWDTFLPDTMRFVIAIVVDLQHLRFCGVLCIARSVSQPR